MIRGTTAQFKFKLPYKFANLGVVKITFWQPGNDGPDAYRPLPIVKTLEQCTRGQTEYELLVILNKEETLRFSDERKAYTQLRAKAIDGTAFASKQETVTVYPVYDDSVLEDEILPTPSPDADGIVILDGMTVSEW